MDVITHGLAGALVAQAGFAQRIGRPAIIALVAGAMLPDLDQDGLFAKAGELEEVQAFLAFARFPWMTARRQGEQTILEYYDLRFGSAPHQNDFRLEVILDCAGAVKHTRLNHRF